MCIAFVYFMVYETKGLTLEQVDELYAEVSVARRSVGWIPRSNNVNHDAHKHEEGVRVEYNE